MFDEVHISSVQIHYSIMVIINNAEPKQSKRGWEGLKVRVGSEILVLLRKSLERWIGKAPPILSTQSLRVPKPPATPPLLLVVVPFQFGEIASSLL